MRIFHVNLLDHAALGDARPLGVRTARRAFAALVAALAAWNGAATERRQLLSLTGRDLKDLGLSRVDAVREATRPLWPTIRDAAVAAWRAP